MGVLLHGERFEVYGESSVPTTAHVWQQRTSRVSILRLGDPEEVDALVAFLVSESACFITGTAVNIAGEVVAVVERERATPYGLPRFMRL